MRACLLLILLIVTQQYSAQNFTVSDLDSFTGLWSGRVAFSDIDGDGDEDVLNTGLDASDVRSCILYTNDGQGVFTEVIGTPFDGVDGSSADFLDVDGDNAEDVIITGQSDDTWITKLYLNDGLGNFSEDLESSFEGVWAGDIDHSDVDDEGDLDLLTSGIEPFFRARSESISQRWSGSLHCNG